MLLVNNDDVVAPGGGFDTHSHRDMEIVTWVLQGSLVHQDSTGRDGLIYPGLAQRMSAGQGIRHAERNASSTEPVRFIQMWVQPAEMAGEPGYEQLEIEPVRLDGAWATVASGLGRDADTAAVSIRQGAALQVARLRAGQQVALPTAPFVHLYVATGSVELAGAGHLGTGDAARVTGATGQPVLAAEPTELLAWEMHTSLTV